MSPSSMYILNPNVLPPGSMVFGGNVGIEEVEWMRKGLEQKIMESRIWRKMGRKMQKYVSKYMKIKVGEFYFFSDFLISFLLKKELN